MEVSNIEIPNSKDLSLNSRVLNVVLSFGILKLEFFTKSWGISSAG